MPFIGEDCMSLLHMMYITPPCLPCTHSPCHFKLLYK